MWNLSKIPKIAHFYFGGEKLEYLRFLSMYSFLKLNQDWEINFYYPKYITKDITWDTGEQQNFNIKTNYIENLKKLPINIKEINFQRLGISDQISEVHKSDYLRLLLLSTVGGLWSDTDILYYRSIDNLQINYKNNSIDTVFCINKSPLYHFIGFLLASEKNVIYQKLYNNIENYFDKTEYQCIGTKMYTKIYPNMYNIKHQFSSNNPVNLYKDSVYPYTSDEINKIYSTTNQLLYDPKNIGIHWFGGHPITRRFLEKTDGGLNIESNNILKIIIDQFYQ